MTTKLGEVYYSYKEDSINEIDVFRCIGFEDNEVYFQNIETGRIGHIDDRDICDSDLIGIVPRYTLKIMYIGSTVDDSNISHTGWVLAMAPTADISAAMFEPCYVADLIEPKYISGLKAGSVALEIKLYGWETFETLKNLLYKAHIRPDILKAHERNVPKRNPKPGRKVEKEVPIKGYEIIDLILTAIDKELGVNNLYSTRIDRVSNALYKKGESKLVKFYKEIEMFVTNKITHAYGVKLDITIDISNINKREYMFVRCGDRGNIYVVPYTTAQLPLYKEAYVSDKESRDCIDFLYAAIGRKTS